jgi:hypothetical protein
MNYVELNQAIQNYSENTETLFVSNIPMFIKEAESRIYNSVQLPSLRKNVLGTLTTNNKYLSCPDDWLATYSLAVIDGTGSYSYLLNKDVNFIRESYPQPTDTGIPKYYSLFGPNSGNLNELTFMVGPTPSSNYQVELHYFYYPVSIVQGVISTIGSVTPGTSYNNGVYTNVTLTGGTGNGAAATIVITGGVVSSVSVTNGGSLYSVGDVLSAANSTIGGTGTGFSFPVVTVANAGGTSWLGDNYDPVLFYGAMREAVIFMKGEQDMVAYYEKMYQDAVQQLTRLGTGLERGDSFRDGQAKIRVSP